VADRVRIDMIDGTPCKPWNGPVNKHGYGRFYDPVTRKRFLAHRVVWAEAHGEIPPGVVIRHRCDNPPCTELRHLTDGTQADNVADMHERGRAHQGARNTTGKCRYGHTYTDRDWQKGRKGTLVRWCKQCNVERMRKIRAAKKGG
jgi:HNH endonuclease